MSSLLLLSSHQSARGIKSIVAHRLCLLSALPVGRGRVTEARRRETERARHGAGAEDQVVPEPAQHRD